MTKVLYSSTRFIRKKKKKTLFASQKLLAAGLPSVIILGGLFYFLFLSPYFGIKNINISGNETVSVDNLKAKIESAISKKTLFLAMANNIFLFPQGRVEKEILADFPKIEDVTINKQVPKNLEVILKERKTVAVWCNAIEDQSNCFFMDANGIIFEKASVNEDSLIIFKIKERLPRTNMSVGGEVFNGEFANKLFDGKNKMEEGLNVSFVEGTVLDGTLTEMKSSEGWKIVFDLNSGVESQIQAVKKIMSEMSQEEKLKLEYFDLRVEGRVYYK